MYLVTIEDDDGMWWESPCASHDKNEAISISRRECPELPSGYARIVYECSVIDEADAATPVRKVADR